MKSWLIIAMAPFFGTETYYCAYSDTDPLEEDDFPYEEILDYLWDSYSYLLYLDDDDYETEEEELEVYEQAREDWDSECNFYSEEIPLSEMEEYGPLDVIYDKRNSSTN